MGTADKHRGVIVLDFGSQYTQLIARRVREAGVYCEILPFNTAFEVIQQQRPYGLILSGSPASVYDDGAPGLPTRFLEEVDCPVLGICYGLQVLAVDLGGSVEASEKREYGYARLKITDASSVLFRRLPPEIDVWMSHGDHVTKVPPGFSITAETAGALNAVEDSRRGIYGLQFHPEVAHTEYGAQILQNFLDGVCRAPRDWSPQAIISEQIKLIRERAGKSRVVCGLSGGVDSTVAAALVHEAIGEQQTCIFVDTGLLREAEFESMQLLFKNRLQFNVHGARSSEQFLSALAGVVDPEQKRRIIGHTFIEVFDAEARRIGDVEYLVQGTLYPDVIESVSVHGPAAVIKSHHNVGGLPERMNLKLIEPLRELFKDEVRVIGRQLGLPAEIIERHPFPGPGLAVRILGEVTRERLALLRAADSIVEEELRASRLYDQVWQAFPVLLPISTVGVMGDFRTYERVIALRAITSTDGMTADWARLPFAVLARISNRLVAEVRGVNRVVYDISSKPPSTIEWE